ncbi:MAG: transposase [Opitutaceae bacterium]
MMAEIFWMLDNGAKWKDLPAESGAQSAVHRWFCRWTSEVVWEREHPGERGCLILWSLLRNWSAHHRRQGRRQRQTRCRARRA